MGLFRNNGDKFDKWADKLGQKMVDWGEKQMKKLEAQDGVERMQEASDQKIDGMYEKRLGQFTRDEEYYESDGDYEDFREDYSNRDEEPDEDYRHRISEEYIEDLERRREAYGQSQIQRGLTKEEIADEDALNRLYTTYAQEHHESVRRYFGYIRGMFCVPAEEVPYDAIRTQVVNYLASKDIHREL